LIPSMAWHHLPPQQNPETQSLTRLTGPTLILSRQKKEGMIKQRKDRLKEK
jgi:hypothetical protein